jgi:hypothetical protein
LACALLLAAYAALAIGLERLSNRLDPADDAWSSVVWAFGAWRGGLRWTAWCVLATALGAGLFWALPDNWGIFAMVFGALPLLAFALWLPFLAWNRDSLVGDRVPRRWPSRWPGAAPVVAFVGVEVAGRIFDDAFDTLDYSASLALDAVLWIPLLVLNAVVLLAWLDRATFRDGRRLFRQVWRRRVVGPLVIRDLRIGLVLSILMLPVLPIYALQIFLVPQVEEILGAFTPGWAAAVAASRGITQWWWLIVLALAVPLAWIALVYSARLLLQVTGSATPPTRPDSGPASTSPPTA